MAWQKDHKQKTRLKILKSGAKLFTLKGFDKVGINDVMADAGLTRGAFYSHFSSKAELYAESMRTAGSRRAKNILNRSPEESTAALQALVNGYLSQGHRKSEEGGCPLAFLVTDITQQDEQVRDVYTEVFRGFMDMLGSRLGMSEAADADAQKSQVLQKTVMMVGGMAIARALNDDDLAEELLQACRQGMLEDIPATA
ncbi:TetR/AcrR family transcriptional regulator [Aliamphritea spongicola]|uniref:TetR/AcrR family transcriptional regulator n=1 Tax=Aliamphritea spongicola TaxID=707589 RepID=UPI00196B382B|nr:TetR/AcrR family transcriptional regulator [Aliamphritea spongicola]MBN3560970.1 TetR/AcrR family transcriptional regulator [Aliamphritea spongicola]